AAVQPGGAAGGGGEDPRPFARTDRGDCGSHTRLRGRRRRVPRARPRRRAEADHRAGPPVVPRGRLPAPHRPDPDRLMAVFTERAVASAALDRVPGSFDMSVRAFQCWLVAYRRTWRSSIW